jgi:trk system potassium uptake protein TrkA
MIRRFAVIGLGRFGSRLAERLALAGQEVIAIDENRQRIEEIRDKVTLAISLDATDEEALRSQGIDQVDVAVVGIGHGFEAGALIVSVLKQMGVPKVIGRAMTGNIGIILRRIGADDVVNPEQESADRWCTRLVGPEFIAHHELDEHHHLVEVACPKHWQGKTLQQLEPRAKLNLYIVALRRPLVSEEGPAGKRASGAEQDPEGRPPMRIVPPNPTEPLQAQDVLIVMGHDSDLARLEA